MLSNQDLKSIRGILREEIDTRVPEIIKASVPAIIKAEIQATVPPMIKSGIEAVVPDMMRAETDDLSQITSVLINDVASIRKDLVTIQESITGLRFELRSILSNHESRIGTLEAHVHIKN